MLVPSSLNHLTASVQFCSGFMVGAVMSSREVAQEYFCHLLILQEVGSAGAVRSSDI